MSRWDSPILDCYVCSALFMVRLESARSASSQSPRWEVASPSFVISVGYNMHLDITNTLSHPPV